MMSNVKQKWTSVSIPLKLWRRIKEVLGFTTDQSVAEYVRQATQKRLQYDEAHVEEQKMLEAEIKERLKD